MSPAAILHLVLMRTAICNSVQNIRQQDRYDHFFPVSNIIIYNSTKTFNFLLF